MAASPNRLSVNSRSGHNNNEEASRLSIDDLLSQVTGQREQLPAPSSDTIDGVIDQGTSNKSTARRDEVKDTQSSTGFFLFPNSDFEVTDLKPSDDLPDDVHKWDVTSGTREDDDSMSEASALATSPLENTDLKAPARVGFDNITDSFEWDTRGDLVKKYDGCSNAIFFNGSSVRDTFEEFSANFAPCATVESNAGRVSRGTQAEDEEDDISLMSFTGINSSQDSDDEALAPYYSDIAIDGLVSTMENHLVIRDIAIQDPNMITVPRGFLMTENTTPDQYYMDQRAVNMYVKRKRDTEILTEAPAYAFTNEQYGFRADEINSSGAIFTYDFKPSDLSNDIHPLLSRSHFDDTPDKIYDQLVPALRLASMCLTQPACMQFWVTLALGKRKPDHTMSKKYQTYCERINSHVQVTDENIALVAKELECLANDNLIHIAFRNKMFMPVPDAWGCSTLVLEKSAEGKEPLARSLIRLHADYYIVAEKLSQLKYPEPSQVLRFSFVFAAIILHEMAHSVDLAYHKRRSYRGQQHSSVKRYMEPFLLDWKNPPESGRFLEHTLFGGEVQPINKKVDGSHGLCTADWPPLGVPSDPKRRIWYTIPMDYIQSLFRMETWRRKGHLRNSTTFHIPRTGARALYIASFTTMDWSESDEAIEALALAKAQPASKKRLIATGEGEDKRTEEDKVISHLLNQSQAKRMEEASWHSRESPLFRRHSFHANDANVDENMQPPKSRGRRSWSFTTLDESSNWSRRTRDAIVNELGHKLQAIYDSLPSHHEPRTSEEKLPASEIVKNVRRSTRIARRKILSAPSQSSTLQSLELENKQSLRGQ